MAHPRCPADSFECFVGRPAAPSARACRTCYRGSSGPCQSLANGVCFGYHEGTAACPAGTVECTAYEGPPWPVDAGGACTGCWPGTRGPCQQANGVCFEYFPATALCPTGTSACHAVPHATPTPTPVPLPTNGTAVGVPQGGLLYRVAVTCAGCRGAVAQTPSQPCAPLGWTGGVCLPLVVTLTLQHWGARRDLGVDVSVGGGDVNQVWVQLPEELILALPPGVGLVLTLTSGVGPGGPTVGPDVTGCTRNDFTPGPGPWVVSGTGCVPGSYVALAVPQESPSPAPFGFGDSVTDPSPTLGRAGSSVSPILVVAIVCGVVGVVAAVVAVVVFRRQHSAVAASPGPGPLVPRVVGRGAQESQGPLGGRPGGAAPVEGVGVDGPGLGCGAEAGPAVPQAALGAPGEGEGVVGQDPGDQDAWSWSDVEAEVEANNAEWRGAEGAENRGDADSAPAQGCRLVEGAGVWGREAPPRLPVAPGPQVEQVAVVVAAGRTPSPVAAGDAPSGTPVPPVIPVVVVPSRAPSRPSSGGGPAGRPASSSSAGPSGRAHPPSGAGAPQRAATHAPGAPCSRSAVVHGARLGLSLGKTQARQPRGSRPGLAVAPGGPPAASGDAEVDEGVEGAVEWLPGSIPGLLGPGEAGEGGQMAPTSPLARGGGRGGPLLPALCTQWEGASGRAVRAPVLPPLAVRHATNGWTAAAPVGEAVLGPGADARPGGEEGAGEVQADTEVAATHALAVASPGPGQEDAELVFWKLFDSP
jgi:hypothetical protein